MYRQKKQQNTLRKQYSMPELKVKIQEMLNEYTGATVLEMGLEEELRKNQEEHRRAVSASIRTCCSGNYGAKETVRELIRAYLVDALELRREEIRHIIPFHAPQQMSAWQQLETMMLVLDKEEDNQGFRHLCERSGWNQPGYIVSEEVIQKEYLEMKPELTEEEECKILSQLLFAGTVGLGIIDTLNQQKGYIEEIQIGMSGRPEQQYDYKEELSGNSKSDNFSRDGVHVMAKGCTIWLKCLSFETEAELQRVLRNLIKDSQGGELTKNHPMMVVDTVDGRRVSVSRPPMTDAWVGLIRKFDTVQEVSFEKLYQGYPEEKLLPQVLRQLVRSGRNIAITGEMASGKTTLFRACLAETRKDMNLRVIEADSFELNVRGFLPKSNTMTMRVTEATPAEEVLAFARKTTGQIFAIGEVNSATVAAMAMDLSKIASQLLFSAHYVTTEHMIADFVNAKLCIGGYSEERLAELDVVRCLGFDIHMKIRQGKRYVQYINEVIPAERDKWKEKQTYEIRPIYLFDEEKEQGIILNAPGKGSYEKAKQVLGKEEYMEFCSFFESKV